MRKKAPVLPTTHLFRFPDYEHPTILPLSEDYDVRVLLPHHSPG